MVNASINLASICGILLFLWGLLATPAGISQVIFYLISINRKEGRSIVFVFKIAYRVFLTLGRFLGSLFVGNLLFAQGWRLDPILQAVMVVLILMNFMESANSVINDFLKWYRWQRNRKTIH
tara:strand:+ start:448 stop:813 length:366 start_codon:yes stop_codon:yes gene_type:complete